MSSGDNSGDISSNVRSHGRKVSSVDGVTIDGDGMKVLRKVSRRRGRESGRASDSLRILKRNFKDVKRVIEGLSGIKQKQQEHTHIHELLQYIDDVTSGMEGSKPKNRTVGRDVRVGMELAMLMYAYEKTGIGSLAVFYYLVCKEDPSLMAKLGSKLLPRHITTDMKPEITYAQQINIKPFIENGSIDSVVEKLGKKDINFIDDIKVNGERLCSTDD